MAMKFIKGSLLVKTLLKKHGEFIKIERATQTRDSDRGTDYTTYDTTLSTRALVTNTQGWIEIFYPYGRAYSGDYLMILSPKATIDIHDRIIYDDKKFKLNELTDRFYFKEIVVERC